MAEGYRLSTVELIFCYSMGLIIFTIGLLLYFGTTKGIDGCDRGTNQQRMWFFTEVRIADCPAVRTWYIFGIISIAVGLVISIVTIIAQFI
jgi:hypothetical protein